METSNDQREGPETERRLSRVGAITEAFRTLTLAAPNELIRAYVMERHELEVKDEMIESLRRLVRE